MLRSDPRGGGYGCRVYAIVGRVASSTNVRKLRHKSGRTLGLSSTSVDMKVPCSATGGLAGRLMPSTEGTERCPGMQRRGDFYGSHGNDS